MIPCKYKKYGMYVDGFKITEVELPDTVECRTQRYRDRIRAELAKHYSIPIHYIRLRPAIIEGGLGFIKKGKIQ